MPWALASIEALIQARISLNFSIKTINYRSYLDYLCGFPGAVIGLFTPLQAYVGSDANPLKAIVL